MYAMWLSNRFKLLKPSRSWLALGYPFAMDGDETRARWTGGKVFFGIEAWQI
jgi:hypothetical protein